MLTSVRIVTAWEFLSLLGQGSGLEPAGDEVGEQLPLEVSFPGWLQVWLQVWLQGSLRGG